jgi:hypothetical protein
MRRMRVLSAGLLCAFSLNAQAEWKGSLGVDASFEELYWTAGKIPPDNNQYRFIGTLKAPMSLKNGRTLRFRFLPLFQSDNNSPSKNERLYFDAQEAYMQLQWLPWTIQLGSNVQTWGDTDVFNPLDVVNARRYYDPLRSEKMGAPTILVKREWETFLIEALYIPRQRETKIPGEQSRWLPREVYKSRSFEGVAVNNSTLSGVLNLPADLRYHYENSVVLTAATNDNIGGRLKFRLPGFDWTLAGFQGAAAAPSVNLHIFRIVSFLPFDATTANVSVGSDIFMIPVYFKNRMLGTSFVWVLGDFLVKGASAQNHVVSTYLSGQLPPDSLPKDSLENVLGIERTFSVGKGALTALLQGTYVKRDEKLDTNSVSLSRMFDRAGMLGLRWSAGDRFTLMGSVLYDTRFKGDLEHFEASYKIQDGWLAKVAADLLGGGPETPLGTYRRNDRVVVSLEVRK